MHHYRDRHCRARRLVRRCLESPFPARLCLGSQCPVRRCYARQYRRLERASLVSSEGHWELDLRTGQNWLSSSYHALLGYKAGDFPVTEAAASRILSLPMYAELTNEQIEYVADAVCAGF